MTFRFNPLRRSLVLALGAAAMVLSAPAQSADDGLLIYNAQHVSLTRAWVEACTRVTAVTTKSPTRSSRKVRRRLPIFS